MVSVPAAQGDSANAANGQRNRRFKLEGFWGHMADYERPVRVMALLLVLSAIASMSFTQLGFWSIGSIEGKPLYVMMLLAPIVAGALLFGPLLGACIGLFAGVVVYLHAMLLPLDFYEYYFMTPLNTFVLLTVLGLVAGWLFDSIAHHKLEGVARLGALVGVCLTLSLTVSVLVQLNTFIMYTFPAGDKAGEAMSYVLSTIISSQLGILAQALIDAVFIVVACLVVYAVMRHTVGRQEKRKLQTTFTSWIIAVSVFVFWTTSGVIFTIATLQGQATCREDMQSEIVYLQTQMNSQDRRNPSTLMDGYEADLDGTVFLLNKRGTIIATDNDEEFPFGSSLVELVGYKPSDNVLHGTSAEDDLGNDVDYHEAATREYLEPFIEREGDPLPVQAISKDGDTSMDLVYMAAGTSKKGYIVMLCPPELIYRNRPSIMTSAALLAFALIVAMALLASYLLDRLIVRKIDEIDESLHLITDGNLNERVRVRDSLEFSSLSRGINATVTALRNSVEEAERKNALELVTAKTIQESTLPREFPPFPEIDRFDLYASMKTAREVGGDFYDFFLLDDDKIGFVIADVAGKGIPAALFMMSSKTQIRSYMEAGLPIDEAVSAANHQLCLHNEAGMFITMVACVLDYNTGLLTYVNAGHNPPVVLHDGTWEWLRGVSGMPLGAFDDITYKPFQRKLETGDMFYLYTDGVTEAMNAEGQQFGEKRLETTLYGYPTLYSRSLCVGVRRAITDFTLDAEQSDDITMLALKYGVPPEKKAVMVLKASDEQLVHMYNFIHEELNRRGAPKSVRNPLDIAAEELFVNVCHYAYPDATPENPGEVRIGFWYEANPPSLTIEIADDGIPYNPLAKPDAVTPDNIADVPIGGLGILMAKRSVDDMTYRRENGSNILTFRKGW